MGLEAGLEGRRVLFISYNGMLDPLGQTQVLPYLRELAKKGVELSTQAERADDDGLFYELVNQAHESLTLSRPYVKDGVPWPESHLWRAARALFPELSVERLRVGAVVPAGEAATRQEVALAFADAEFGVNACIGARETSKKLKLKIVYDRGYPPSTADFSPIVRAVQAANPDLFVICSYPLDSVGMVKAINEIGFKPKMVGGAMVGLQATVFTNQLGPLLNGFVNYETWVPSKQMMTPETEAFLKKYQARAGAAGVDPLGYYLGTWGYAHIAVYGDAIRATKSLKDDVLADYIRKTTFKTILGDVKYGKNGEWAKSGMLQVQYHGIKKGAGLDVWRGMSYQTVLTPSNLKTGNLIYPFEKAR